MSDVREFKHPEKQPFDPLLARDPMLDNFNLNREARIIYLRIVRDSKPGILLQVDRMAVELTAQMVGLALSVEGGEYFISSIEESFDQLLAPELGRDYINQVLAKR